MRTLLLATITVTLFTATAAARIGDPIAAFTGGPLMQQLQLAPSGQGAVSDRPGSTAYRYVSDDQAITVYVVVQGGLIEQEMMYLPMSEQRGIQVSYFLQDALGSVFGAQMGIVAFRNALANRSETSMNFGGYTMRFTPTGQVLRVLVSR